jgi:hypothetical protein
MVAAMTAVVILPGAMLPVAVGLLMAAVVLGRAARTAIWAREAIVDLWAMALLTLGALATAGHSVTSAAVHTGSPASHHGGAPAGVFEFVVSPGVVIAAWMLARAVLGRVAFRTGSIRHSLVTAAAGAAQLLVMLTLH